MANGLLEVKKCKRETNGLLEVNNCKRDYICSIFFLLKKNSLLIFVGQGPIKIQEGQRPRAPLPYPQKRFPRRRRTMRRNQKKLVRLRPSDCVPPICASTTHRAFAYRRWGSCVYSWSHCGGVRRNQACGLSWRS